MRKSYRRAPIGSRSVAFGSLASHPSARMDWTTLVPAIIGAFVGVMGWLIVGLYIQRRQFDRQARNAAKAVYFELDVNFATISVARDHGLFSDLDRSSFERLLPELATLMPAQDLKTVVDAYMTHAGYRQLASRDDLPAEVRKGALAAFISAHERALATLRSSVFTTAEVRAMGGSAPVGEPANPANAAARTKP
jgi:hypothetical protein